MKAQTKEPLRRSMTTSPTPNMLTPVSQDPSANGEDLGIWKQRHCSLCLHCDLFDL